MLSLPGELIWLIGQSLNSADFDNFGSTNRRLRRILIENTHRWQAELRSRYPGKTEDQILDLFRGDDHRLSNFVHLPTPLFNRLAGPFNPYWMAVRMIERANVTVDVFDDEGRIIQSRRNAKIRTFLGHPQSDYDVMDMISSLEHDLLAYDFTYENHRYFGNTGNYRTNPLDHMMKNLSHGISPDLVATIIDQYGAADSKQSQIDYCRMILTDDVRSLLVTKLTDVQEQCIIKADALMIYQARYQPTQSDAIYYCSRRDLDQPPRIANYLYHLARTPINSLEQLLILLDKDPGYLGYRRFAGTMIDPSLIGQFLTQVSVTNYSDGDYPKSWVDFVARMIFKNYQVLWKDFFDLLGRVVDQFIDQWQHPLIDLVRQVLFDHEDLGYVQEQLIDYFNENFEPTNYFGILVYLAIHGHPFKNRHVFPSFNLTTNQIHLYGIELNQPWREIFLILPPGTTLVGEQIVFVRMINQNNSTKMTMELPIIVSNPQIAIPAIICQ